MTGRLLLVRHGAHDLLGKVLCGRAVDVALNAEGEAQAVRLGAAQAGLGVKKIFSSPLRRACQTAAPIATACGLAIEVADALQEIDFGGWAGAPFDRLAGDASWQGWNAARLHHRPPGGETMGEVQVRVVRWIEGLACDGVMVAVSHADVIKAAVCHALKLSLDHHGRFDIDPASVTTIVVGDWGMKVERLNLAGVLPPVNKHETTLRHGAVAQA